MLEDYLSPKQLSRLLKEGGMKPFISPATRTKCSGCGGTRFEKKRSREFDNEIPICIFCEGRPKLFRVIVELPQLGKNTFEKVSRTTDQNKRKLNTPSRADAYCEYIKEKLKINHLEFDPREIGNKEDMDRLIVKTNGPKYLGDQEDRISINELSPGGYSKKERVMRLYILPIFGDYMVRDLTHQTINRALSKTHTPDKKTRLTNSIKTEIITELSVFTKWCCEEGLIKSKPQLPSKPKGKKINPDQLYSIEERDMVINNIPDIKARIGCIFMAVYTRRKCEVICMKWGDFNFKSEEVTFSSHISDGKGVTPTLNIKGMKSSPDKIVRYKFFKGIKGLLFQLNPSLNPKEFVFKGKQPGTSVHKNYFYEAWKKSALELIDQGKLDKYCDMHRGTRSSTLTSLAESGYSSTQLGQLYAGDEKTMNAFYIKQSIQNTEGILTSEGLV